MKQNKTINDMKALAGDFATLQNKMNKIWGGGGAATNRAGGVGTNNPGLGLGTNNPGLGLGTNNPGLGLGTNQP